MYFLEALKKVHVLVEDMVEDMEIVNISVDACTKPQIVENCN